MSTELGTEDEGTKEEGTELDNGTAQDEETKIESIYGDLEVKWPEGLSDDLKNEPSLKPFVKEDGTIDFGNLAKSYHNTKKDYGRAKTILPSENATKEEIDEFYTKVNGFDPEYANYKPNINQEDSPLDEAFNESIKQFAHINRLPAKAAEELHDLLAEAAKDEDESATANHVEMVEKGVDQLKSKWGESYDPRIAGAKRLISDYLGEDEKLMEAFDDPEIGSNPFIMELLGTISSKLYEEGEFHGKGDNLNMTPEDVELQISAIMNDGGHPYHNADKGAEHQNAVKEMLKLFEVRTKYKNKN